MKKENDISNYSKEELIWIIDYLKHIYGEHQVNRALEELNIKREAEKIAEAKKYVEVAHSKRMEYLSLIKPYDGQPFISIPSEIRTRAQNALKEATAADKKYNKLMRAKK